MTFDNLAATAIIPDKYNRNFDVSFKRLVTINVHQNLASTATNSTTENSIQLLNHYMHEVNVNKMFKVAKVYKDCEFH